MIDFTADWCAYCKKLDRSTFPAKEVKSEGERFVRLRADQTERSSADVLARQKKYSISGLPTIVFLDGNGNEVKNARIVGFVNPHELEMKMRSVR
jgi:thiol:disulfide interchange protein DsbD